MNEKEPEGKSPPDVIIEQPQNTEDNPQNTQKDENVRENLDYVPRGRAKPKAQPFTPPPVKFYNLFRFSQGADQALMAAGILGSIFSGLTATANTYLFGDITNALVHYLPGDERDFLEDIDSYAITTTLLGVAVMLLSYTSIVIYSYAFRRQILKIRLMYFKASLCQEISFYDIYGTGEFASRISEDLNKLEDGLSEKVLQVVHSLSAFCGCVVLSLSQGWELALISLSTLPIILVSVKGLSMASNRFSKTELEEHAKASTVAQEVLSSIKTVVAFNGQKKERIRYDQHLSRAKKSNIKKGFCNAMVFGVLWFLIYAAYGTGFWFGVQFVFDEKYSPGQVTTIFLSVIVGTLNLLIIGPYLEVFSSAKAAAGVVFWVIDRISAIDPNSDSGLKPEIKGNIEFKNVHFTYQTRPGLPVLKGISLKINMGETVALVGSSGSGKSTCIQLIQRFYDPTEGELLIDGEDIRNINVSYLRRHIGVVGQEPVLFSATVKENILYSKEGATDEEVTAACVKANAHTFISKLPKAYDTPVGEKGAQMSGGQKQRIAIARALIRDPRILLLDEATSALDNVSESKVQKALEEASQGRTTLIVAHRLSTIRNADKIVVLSKGQIVEEGTHEELYKKEGHYFELVTAQAHRLEEEFEGSDDTLDKLHKLGTGTSERDESLVSTRTEKISDTQIVTKVPLKEIMRLNAPEWKWILSGTFASMLIGCSYPIFTVVFGDIIGVLALTREEALEETKIYCLSFTLIGILMAASTFIQIWTYTTAGAKLTMRLRSQTFAAMLRQDMAWFDEKGNSIGILCSRLSNDASNVQAATGQTLGSLVQAGSSVLLAIAFMLSFQWKLGLVTIFIGPFLIGGSYFLIKNLKGGMNKAQKIIENSTKVAFESIVNIRTVAGLGRERALFEEYKDELKPARKVVLNSAHTKGLIMGLARSLMFYSYAVCLFYGGRLIAYEHTNYEDVLKVTQTLIIVSFSVAQAFAYTANFQKGLISATKICTLLMRRPGITSPETEVVNMTWAAEGDVSYENISFRYPTRPREPILKDFNLDILRGKKVALVGQSGCGKSTLLQLLLRFYDPDEGIVSIDNNDIKKIKLNHLRKQLGIVTQEPVLFDRTIGENIAYGDNDRSVPEGDIIDAAEKANAHGFISSLPLGYNTLLGENGVQLSGGQKQRLAIARALVRKPKVLLLDEATSALDTQSEKIVQEALVKASMGRTCIIIAHRLSTIVDADMIVVMSQGMVAEMGTHTELVSKKGIYRKLYALQGKG